MNKLFPIVLALLFFGCDGDNPSSSGNSISDASEVANNFISSQKIMLIE